MGVEKITFGEEEYRMSPPLLSQQILTGRTRLRPTIIKSSSDSFNAFILHTKCCNLVRFSHSPSPFLRANSQPYSNSSILIPERQIISFPIRYNRS